jgi:hypothetical protein
MVSGMGVSPSGPELPLEFERRHLVWGLTVTTSPWDDVSLFASYFRTYDDQNYHLVLSGLPRYWQPVATVDFFEDGAPDHRNEQMSFILGTHVRFSDETDGGLSYSFTRAELKYESNAISANVRQIFDNRGIDSDIHGIQLEVGHWLRDGLRVRAGYRLQFLDDSSPQPSGTGSVVQPVSPSMTQHTVTIGVTLTSDLIAKSE